MRTLLYRLLLSAVIAASFLLNPLPALAETPSIYHLDTTALYLNNKELGRFICESYYNNLSIVRVVFSSPRNAFDTSTGQSVPEYFLEGMTESSRIDLTNPPYTIAFTPAQEYVTPDGTTYAFAQSFTKEKGKIRLAKLYAQMKVDSPYGVQLPVLNSIGKTPVVKCGTPELDDTNELPETQRNIIPSRGQSMQSQVCYTLVLPPVFKIPLGCRPN
ncbi:hypothetical protein H6F43_04125 [Leptolyngbya sp. FACHB-36]|uniref:hypothetical protein n=1 Tax=Leptolyngbya sp. FACHB-36 TaxID=2692808 RepID=UPI0016803E71|nr:hypothetical protein [Leptolyngbya sp. FACHB-36]MBD2019370.1 hypothetical protein [Leptolyngbya sp. FACHB-36]